jgi:hypothetical protein
MDVAEYQLRLRQVLLKRIRNWKEAHEEKSKKWLETQTSENLDAAALFQSLDTDYECPSYAKITQLPRVISSVNLLNLKSTPYLHLVYLFLIRYCSTRQNVEQLINLSMQSKNIDIILAHGDAKYLKCCYHDEFDSFRKLNDNNERKRAVPVRNPKKIDKTQHNDVDDSDKVEIEHQHTEVGHIHKSCSQFGPVYISLQRVVCFSHGGNQYKRNTRYDTIALIIFPPPVLLCLSCGVENEPTLVNDVYEQKISEYKHGTCCNNCHNGGQHLCRSRSVENVQNGIIAWYCIKCKPLYLVNWRNNKVYCLGCIPNKRNKVSNLSQNIEKHWNKEVFRKTDLQIIPTVVISLITQYVIGL